MEVQTYVKRMEAAVLKANAAIQKLKAQNDALSKENQRLKDEMDALKRKAPTSSQGQSLGTSGIASDEMIFNIDEVLGGGAVEVPSKRYGRIVQFFCLF